MRRFEFKEGTSSKFWEVDVEGKDLTVRFGKIGTNGQTQTKSFPTAEKATSERDKLIKEKTSKGYAELSVDDGAKPPRDGRLEKVEPKESAAPKAKAKEAPADEPGWIDAGDGYRLALRDGKLACRGPKGQLLASVPKDVKTSPVAMDPREEARRRGEARARAAGGVPSGRVGQVAEGEEPAARRLEEVLLPRRRSLSGERARAQRPAPSASRAVRDRVEARAVG